jgi:hypothetical protein
MKTIKGFISKDVAEKGWEVINIRNKLITQTPIFKDCRRVIADVPAILTVDDEQPIGDINGKCLSCGAAMPELKHGNTDHDESLSYALKQSLVDKLAAALKNLMRKEDNDNE